MKHHQHIIIQIILDALLMIGAFYLAYYLRFTSGMFAGSAPEAAESYSYDQQLYVLVPLGILTLLFSGVYRRKMLEDFRIGIKRVCLSNLIYLMLSAAYFFFIEDDKISRIFLVIFILLAALFECAARSIFDWMIEKEWIKKASAPVTKKRAYVIGAGDHAGKLISENKKICEGNGQGYSIEGLFDDFFPSGEKDGVPVLGNLSKLKDYLQNPDNLEVIIAIPGSNATKIQNVIDTAREAKVPVRLIPDAYDFYVLDAAQNPPIGTVPFVTVYDKPKKKESSFGKLKAKLFD